MRSESSFSPKRECVFRQNEAVSGEIDVVWLAMGKHWRRGCETDVHESALLLAPCCWIQPDTREQDIWRLPVETCQLICGLAPKLPVLPDSREAVVTMTNRRMHGARPELQLQLQAITPHIRNPHLLIGQRKTDALTSLFAPASRKIFRFLQSRSKLQPFPRPSEQFVFPFRKSAALPPERSIRNNPVRQKTVLTDLHQISCCIVICWFSRSNNAVDQCNSTDDYCSEDETM